MLPKGHGYANLLGGISSAAGPFAEARLGYRPLEPLSIFAQARWTPRESTAGAGVEVRF